MNSWMNRVLTSPWTPIVSAMGISAAIAGGISTRAWTERAYFAENYSSHSPRVVLASSQSAGDASDAAASDDQAPPGGTHNGLTDTHYTNSDSHYLGSGKHSAITDTHASPSSWHYRTTISDIQLPPVRHRLPSEVHNDASQWTMHPGGLHNPRTDTHKAGSDIHDRFTTTHSLNSDTHSPTSTTHKRNTVTHTSNSTTHYVSSITHTRNSDYTVPPVVPPVQAGEAEEDGEGSTAGD